MWSRFAGALGVILRANELYTEGSPHEAVEKLTKKSEDPSKWYLQLVRMAKLVDCGPVGDVCHPALRVRDLGAHTGTLDARFKATGHQNAYFPPDPESYSSERPRSSAGLRSEQAWVTVGGRGGTGGAARRPTGERNLRLPYRSRATATSRPHKPVVT